MTWSRPSTNNVHQADPLPAGEEILTAAEVADLLRIHPSTVYKLLRQGELPAFKVGSNWRFLRTSIDEWLTSQSMKASEGQLYAEETVQTAKAISMRAVAEEGLTPDRAGVVQGRMRRDRR